MIITRIETLGLRCLRHVSQPMEAFHVLVGPNASGKTTFLDVVAFLGDLVSEGIDDRHPALKEWQGETNTAGRTVPRWWSSSRSSSPGSGAGPHTSRECSAGKVVLRI